MSAPSPHYSFVPDPHTAQYLAMDDRSHDRSPSPARKFWPFNRSRSSSPNTQPQLHLDTSMHSNRSRKSSANSAQAVSPSGSASSFVVRSVIRNPNGVSLPGSPAHEQKQPFFPHSSPQRRMKLEDSDDEQDAAQQQQQQQQLQYRRSKSKPLGAATASLGVPPGGPGGGIGYGTARSSNDGRPEAAGGQPSPYYRPASPSGSIKAGDFNRAKERGRSPRKSISGTPAASPSPADGMRSGSAHSATSSDAKKPVARITAGPKSLVQQQQEHHHFQPQPSSRGQSPAAGPRLHGLSGPRQFPPGQSYPQAYQASPSADPRGNFGFPPMAPPNGPHDGNRDESPSRSRRFSFGIGARSRKDSDKAAPLDGLPSPVDIPYGRSPHSPLRFDAGADTDYSRANSPFGSASPVRATASPSSSGFLATLVGRHTSGEHKAQRDEVPRSCSPGGGSNLAGKWFKGVFGRSPRGEEQEPAYADEMSPYMIRDADEQAAMAQKMASMRQARHIVDQERQQWMASSTPTRASEFRPRQIVDSDNGEDDAQEDDAAMLHELGRKKSPPGRKPVPAYLPATSPRVGDEAPRAVDEPLTPAQRIIHETRSKQLAREQIEAQRRHAAVQQTQLRQAPKPDPHAPATPPKTAQPAAAAAASHAPRFPSGAHQLTREPARASGSTLSPGSGPMPAEMPLRDALQEMMVRFYRFERYSVPLIRALEARLVDMERDAMLATNAHARGSVGSSSSAHSAEMDRWVTQMAALMKHEVGQLKAATREIKESRELVAEVARTAPVQGGKPAGAVPVSTSVSSFGSIHAVTPSASASLQQMPTLPESPAKARQTNVSSSTFESAVPRAVGAQPRNLALPAGAMPALDRDEGKHGANSPTKAIFGFASESAKEQAGRERSVSPNGRPRFTSVLGQPLVHGRLSPSPSPTAEVEPQPAMKRDVSVEDRLKALVDGASTRSRSSSVASAAREPEDEADDSGTAEINAALAAMEAPTHAKGVSAHTLETLREPVRVVKSASHSSSGSVEEPLTPPVDDAPAIASPVQQRTFFPASAAVEEVAKPAPTVASGRISPNKLFAHKFAATPSNGSAHSSHSATGVGSPSAKLGLVEKKRFTLGAPVSPVAVQKGRLSRTPSANLDDAVQPPTSAAFSGIAKVKPVGHTATLRERVAFFDTAK